VGGGVGGVGGGGHPAVLAGFLTKTNPPPPHPPPPPPSQHAIPQLGRGINETLYEWHHAQQHRLDRAKQCLLLELVLDCVVVTL